MYDIHFYRAPDGSQPVKDYIDELAAKDSKDARINLSKINDYIELLYSRTKLAAVDNLLPRYMQLH